MIRGARSGKLFENCKPKLRNDSDMQSSNAKNITAFSYSSSHFAQASLTVKDRLGISNTDFSTTQKKFYGPEKISLRSDGDRTKLRKPLLLLEI